MNLIYTGPVSYLNRQPLSNTTPADPFSSSRYTTQAQQPYFSARPNKHSQHSHRPQPRERSSSPEYGRRLKHVQGNFYQSKNESQTSFYEVEENRFVSPWLKGMFEKLGCLRRLHKIEDSDRKTSKDYRTYYQVGPDLYINRRHNGYYDNDDKISSREARKKPGYHGQEPKKPKDKKNKEDRNWGNRMADAGGVTINTILTVNAPTQTNRDLIASQASRVLGATTRVVFQHALTPQWPPGISLAKDLVTENIGNFKQYGREWTAKAANRGAKETLGVGIPRKKKKGRKTVVADDGD